MPAPNPVHTTATLLRRHNDRVWIAALPNGKEIMAHIPRKLLPTLVDLAVGECVTMELTVYDFSMGRISGRLLKEQF